MSAQPLTARSRNLVRVLPVPDTEAPVVSPLPTVDLRLLPNLDQPTLSLVDDETSDSTSDSVSGAPSGAQSEPDPTRDALIGIAGTGVFGRTLSAVGDLPDPAGTACTLVRAVVEVLSGARPATQLIRWTDHDVHTALTRRAAITARVRRTVPARRPPVVRGVRTCPLSDRVVEASAVVIEADRVRAVALRLEGHDGRWRITALEVG